MQATPIATKESLSKRLAQLTEPVEDMQEGLLASAVYDGDLKVAVLKFYDPVANRFWLWRDNTGHKPYCFTKQPMAELGPIRARRDVIDITEVQKLDMLADQMVEVRKIVTTDPLAIGGGNDSIRDRIRAWEADIKYFENFVYDEGLRMGTYYKVSGGKVIPLTHEMPERVAHSLEEILRRNIPEFAPYIREWAELLGQPLCDFRRVALDIEVANEVGRIPDPENPRQPVIAVSFYSEEEKLVYLLRQGKADKDFRGEPFGAVLFDNEADLLRAVISKIMDYPVVVTFNGDDFDLRYLKHRADEMGISEEENPIQLERVAASVKHGIHLDLYQLFRNRSIQVYAFSNKYSEHTLGGISESLLGKSKIEVEGEIGDLPLDMLARYCFNDSVLTYDLTSIMSSVVMKLLVVLARIGKMPMNDVARLGVSNWIRSMLFFEHRKINALIPRQDELAEKGGASSEAIIKGKKYKGGLVIEPKPGVYFDVSVLDFASLYPSLIKVHNLSYETVRCRHEECRKNTVPDTTHWVCLKRKGITSLVIGSLRDLRVSHYKPLAKDPTLSKDDRDVYGVVTQALKVILNACFTGDTYVVTPNGIKNVKDFKVGDRVVNVNPETLAVEVDEVIEVQSFDYSGDMYHFRDRRFVDLAVTPNHRMLTMDRRRGSGAGATFHTADEVYGLTNVAIPALKSSLQDQAPPQKVSMLETARGLQADVHFYPGGIRLSNWFRKLSPALQSKIRTLGRVDKKGFKANPCQGSRYVLPAIRVTEEDIDEVERAQGFSMVSVKKGSKIPARFDPVPFAELCGWFASEGNLYETFPRQYVSGNYRGSSSGILISQSYGKGNRNGVLYRGDIGRLLSGLGLPASTDSPNKRYFKVANKILHAWTVRSCYDQSEEQQNARTKRIPEFVFGSKDSMQAFLDSAYMGDGSTRQTLYSTTSRKLAEDLVVLLSCLGAKSRIKWDNGIFRVTFKNRSEKLTYSSTDAHKYVTKEKFDGKVYCVTTAKNHTVIAGRNGRFVPVGQSYGVTGFETFALYCLPVAEATAALGRYSISKTIQKCADLGINVLYSDTDSLFLEHPSKEQVTTVTRWADTDLSVELDLDKSYRYVAFSSRKKNYFGVLPDGTVDITGLPGRKSQTPEYLKRTFYKTIDVLSSVKSPEDFERARASIRELLTSMITGIKGKKVPVADLAFNVIMSKQTEKYGSTTPQHVRAAKLLEDSGKEVKAGEIISYVKTKNPPYVKPAELARPDEIDAEKYIEYAHSMFDQVLDALDFSFDEIMGATTLDFFWTG
jgi:DNA polymerase elongation subunit (family B)